MPSPTERPDAVAAWAPPAALAGLFAALAAASWRRWADPIVDFGREPYLSWQLLEGRTLHRDLASLFGPLSPWVNALWFSLFGASLTTLALCNLALAAGLACVVYRFAHASTDRLAATLATAVLLVGFVFAHQAPDAAGYDFVWPYTHAATHGAILLVCGMVALGRAVADDRPAAWIGAGALLATTALTKPEIALAAGAAALAAVLWQATAAPPGRRARGPVSLAAAAAASLALAGLVFGSAGLAAPWSAIARIAAADRGFYAGVSGAGGLWTNALRVVADATLWIVVAAGLVVLDRRGTAASEAARRRLVIAGAAVVALLLARDLPGTARPLPILVPMAGGVMAAVAWRRPDERTRLVPLVVWAAGAWALLAKMLLDAHFHHYGFYLAMPAAILIVLAGVGAVPRLLAARTPGGGWLVRRVGVATVGLLLVHSLASSVASWTRMSVPVGRGRDALLGPAPDASPTGELAAELERRLGAALPAGATLAVLPDGALLNFLARRPNPTPYHQTMPPELAAFGAARVVAAYDAAPPDWMVLLEWPGDEYGVGVFGGPEWGGEIAAWVARRYERVETVPSRAAAIGFSLWRLRSGRVGRMRHPTWTSRWLRGARLAYAATGE